EAMEKLVVVKRGGGHGLAARRRRGEVGSRSRVVVMGEEETEKLVAVRRGCGHGLAARNGEVREEAGSRRLGFD
ncbi:LOW QUALITY PROTEIN: hypothetical protein HID58_088170, partial [Brassica napus]